MKIIVVLFLLSVSVYCHAQGGLVDSIKTRFDTINYWTKGGNAAFTFQQIGLKNWTAGGNELIALNFSLRGYAKKELVRYVWFNQVDIGYSLSKQGQQRKIRANKDTWKITTRISRKLENNWQLTLGLITQSQFGRLYKVKTDEDTGKEISVLSSQLLSPLYIWPSIGFSYVQEQKYSLSLQPLTGKITLVMDDSLSRAGAYGVKGGKKIRSETGIGIEGSVRLDIMKNIRMESDLNTFSRYSNISFTDIRWGFLLRFKVNKYISANFESDLIYDRSVIDKIQYRYSINLGFSYDLSL